MPRRRWLAFLHQHNYRLPSKAQPFIEACRTRPDFLYEEDQVAIYIDGPNHRYPEHHARDVAQPECMEDRGYTVVRFGLDEDWEHVIARYPNVFGAN